MRICCSKLQLKMKIQLTSKKQKKNTVPARLSISYNGSSSAPFSFTGPLLFCSTETGLGQEAFRDGLTENSPLKSGRRVNRKVNKVEKKKRKRGKNSRKKLCSPSEINTIAQAAPQRLFKTAVCRPALVAHQRIDLFVCRCRHGGPLPPL